MQRMQRDMQALANHSIMHPQTAIGTLRTCAMRTQAKHSAVLVTRLAAAVLLTVLSAHAQTIIPLPTPFPGPEESFTAASVKPNASGALEWDFDTPPGRVVGKNVVLRDLIRFAYNIYGGDWDIRIAGPDWMKTARFDLDATTPGVVPQPRAMSMLRQLLGERFKLRVRYEQRQRPVYALLRAGNDGRLGPQIIPTSVDCAAYKPSPGDLDPDKPPVCGSGRIPGGVRAGGYTMEQLALQLAGAAGRPVIDATGLGKQGFNYELRWNSDTGPSIFTALQEQLGLKLEPRQGPVEVVVIDAIEPPSPN
jgi:uncharacterized protein (TIGR03435 family)